MDVCTPQLFLTVSSAFYKTSVLDSAFRDRLERGVRPWRFAPRLRILFFQRQQQALLCTKHTLTRGHISVPEHGQQRRSKCGRYCAVRRIAAEHRLRGFGRADHTPVLIDSLFARAVCGQAVFIQLAIARFGVQLFQSQWITLPTTYADNVNIVNVHWHSHSQFKWLLHWASVRPNSETQSPIRSSNVKLMGLVFVPLLHLATTLLSCV